MDFEGSGDVVVVVLAGVDQLIREGGVGSIYPLIDDGASSCWIDAPKDTLRRRCDKSGSTWWSRLLS